jgi:Na+-translocating ferredoxin:NAD+ oxidoreductase RnfG subunit
MNDKDKKSLKPSFIHDVPGDSPAPMANVKAIAEQDDKVAKPRMNQSTREILKCIIVLSLIAVVAGALLGTVNYFTYVDNDAAALEEIALYYSVQKNDVKRAQSREISAEGANGSIKSAYEVASKNAFVYRAEGKEAYKGTLEILVYVENDKITKIVAAAHSETQGIGTQALDEAHFSKYYGVDLNQIQAFSLVQSTGANNSDIESISGATKSSKAVNNAINAVVYAHKNGGGGQ